ncbi:unnamed protein product [Miscanthus lutarioriparius]|uniref:Uncharacterized protein n=1 Tax=Miscanthus lutarioriparius TaxID=422564 RepID=A0A811RTZ2_9POAL|nr:unnamed protein product [Miscanthus lutarioriparius]
MVLAVADEVEDPEHGAAAERAVRDEVVQIGDERALQALGTVGEHPHAPRSGGQSLSASTAAASARPPPLAPGGAPAPAAAPASAPPPHATGPPPSPCRRGASWKVPGASNRMLAVGEGREQWSA